MNEDYIREKIQAIENIQFIHIPGPNPILTPGEPGSWDDGMMEMCDILKDDGKYYLYYHATGNGSSYRIGVAVSDHPLGPFVKYSDKPILDLESFGNSSNDRYIACGSILKEGTNRYYLFYSLQQKDDQKNYYIGLATAEHPLGPWKKSEHNPLMKNFGYVGGVTKKDGKYYMFNEYPTHYQASDYGPLCVAVADHPEGPWTPCKDTPVLPVSEWGTWDDAGHSECNVKYDGTLFHMFFGGAKTHADRLRSLESLGYAYSADGMHFIKHSKNPIAQRESIAYGAAIAEVCFLSEYPYIYIYHTLRYKEPWREQDVQRFPKVEHIGAEVLCIADHFQIQYPVYTLKSILPGLHGFDSNKLPLSTSEAKRFALTVSCNFHANAAAPLRLHIQTGIAENAFDDVDTYTFNLDPTPGKTVQRTFTGDVFARFMKVVAENCDSNPICDISVSITLRN